MCPCTKELAYESCDNSPMDALAKVMFSLSTFMQNKSCLRNGLTTCTWPFHTKHIHVEKLYNHRPDYMMKLALCDRAPQPHLI